MKKSELKKMIKEEYKKVIKEVAGFTLSSATKQQIVAFVQDRADKAEKISS